MGREDRFAANLARLERRWPRIAAKARGAGQPWEVIPRPDTPAFTLVVDGRHLSSCVDPVREAACQADAIPASAHRAWIYGPGCGALPDALLARKGLRELHLLVLNTALFRLSLAHFDHRWLDDPRVELGLATPATGVQAPFAVVPPELDLAPPALEPLRDRLRVELDSPYICRSFEQRCHTYRRQIADNAAHIARDADLAELLARRRHEEIAVCAAGPTLDDRYDWLHRHPEIPLICVDAALSPLRLAGIRPALVISIDGCREGILPYFEGDLAGLEQTPLVYFPLVHPEVIERWPGPRFVAVGNHPLYRAVERPLARLHASGTVTHAAVDLARLLGARRIHLLGADFCFAHGRTHATGTANAGTVADYGPGVLCTVRNGHGEPVPTLPNLRNYLRDLEDYVAAHPEIRFIVHGRHGARIAGTVQADET